MLLHSELSAPPKRLDRAEYRDCSPLPTLSQVAAAREQRCLLCVGQELREQPWHHDEACVLGLALQRGVA